MINFLFTLNFTSQALGFIISLLMKVELTS